MATFAMTSPNRLFPVVICASAAAAIGASAVCAAYLVSSNKPPAQTKSPAPSSAMIGSEGGQQDNKHPLENNVVEYPDEIKD